MGYRYQKFAIVGIAFLLLSFIPPKSPQLRILLNGEIITDLIHENDNSYGVGKFNNLKFNILNDTDTKYSIEATIEILPQQFQPTRKNERASKKWKRIPIKTNFKKTPSFKVPTHRFNNLISRIIVTIESVKYLDENNNEIELHGDIFYGIEYSFWNRK